MTSNLRLSVAIAIVLCSACSQKGESLPTAQSQISAATPDSQTRHDSTAPAVTGERKPVGPALAGPELAVINWFDKLGFPDLTERPLVDVRSGWQLEGADDPSAAHEPAPAFLLDDQPDTFTVFTLGLATVTYDKKRGEDIEYWGQFQEMNFDDEVAAALRSVRDSKDDDNPWRGFGRAASERVEIFVLARSCAAKGRNDWARELIDAAAGISDWQSRKPPGIEGLQKVLAEEMAYGVMWRNVLDLGEPRVGRPELLRRFQNFERGFPESQYAASAAEISKMLAFMIEEDAEHARLPRKPLVELPVHERVAELIFQLRDQNGQQMSNPGSCDIFMDPRDGGLFGALLDEAPKGGGSPATQLVALGFDAVPELIKHLDDRTLTRSIGFHRSFRFSHHALRVGDCAHLILERIAGQSFYDPHHTNSQMMKDGEVAPVRRRVEQWWSSIQVKGELPVLVDGVSAGNENSIRLFRKLFQKYPESAAAALCTGIRRAESSWVRSALIELAADVQAAEVNNTLLEQMRQGADLATRVAAGRVLIARTHPDAMSAMIAEWKALSGNTKGDEPARIDDDVEDGMPRLAQLLATGNHAAAIDALATDLGSQPFERRIAVISAFGRRKGNFSMASNGSGSNLNIPDDAPDVSDEVRSHIEDLLVAALDDREERDGMSGHWNGKAFAAPRLCDIAGHILADRIPGKFKFDLEAPTPVRDRMLVVIKNVWRRDRDLPALPVPELPQIARLPDDVTGPLIKRIREGANADERSQAIADMQKLGLGALPAVSEYLAALPQDHSAKPQMTRLAAELASIISEIDWSQSEVDPGAEFRMRLDRLNGTPLTSKSVVDILVEAANGLPGKAVGIKFVAERSNDNSGVHCRVSLTDKRIPTVGTQKGWESVINVGLSRESILNSQGFLSFDYAKGPEAYTELAKAIDQIIAAPADRPFQIRVSFVQSK